MRKSTPDHPPVAMVQVVLDVHDDGTVAVSVDQTFVPPPPATGAWRRGDFAQIIDAASQERAVPVRITVHESDGTSFTDILPAIIRRTTDADPSERVPDWAPADATAAVPSPPIEVRVTGAGFVSGEDIAVALVSGYTDATPTGDARVLLDPAHIAAVGAGEVVLVGRVSGTTTIRALP